MALARVHVLIEGDVQGVGFRFSTERVATKLGLAGWVRNRPEGAVEAVFEGERSVVDQMVAWCHRGPSSAYVNNVNVNWESPSGDLAGFRITF